MKKVNLIIRYHTHWGESIFLCLTKQNKDRVLIIRELALHFKNENEWGESFNYDDIIADGADSYFYRIKKNNTILKEDRSKRIIPNLIHSDLESITINVTDDWNDCVIPDIIYQTDVFTQNRLNNPISLNLPYKPHTSKTVHFCVTTHLLITGKKIGILGSSRELNNWDINNPIVLHQNGNQWQIDIHFDGSGPIYFKYVLYDEKSGEIIAFEKGNNRFFHANVNADGPEIYHHFADFSAYAWKGAGINVPLSGLRSEKDWGIGDFSTLGMTLDWARNCGFTMIQLLPINDTISNGGFRDSYPYSAISAFAIHPVYLDVKTLAEKYGYILEDTILIAAKKLNALPTLDYEATVSLKLKVLKDIFLSIQSQIFDSSSFHAFQKKHHEWLLPYAAFSALRDDFQTADHTQWHSYRKFNRQEIEEVWKNEGRMKTDMLFYVFLQFELQKQFEKISEKANLFGIILKGDLPIGVGRNSVETWTRPELFHMEEQAGAPPDAFTQKGQNWFFPTYNWEEMEKDGYQWWKSRMKQLNLFFHAIRLDHILGFFRIWSIPSECIEGLLGRFVPAKGFTKLEIEQWGLETDIHHLVNPYVTDDILCDRFGDLWQEVKEQFFDSQGFRVEFQNQRELNNYIIAYPKWNFALEGLFDLQAELIFITDQKGACHFRINMMDTAVFKSLTWNDQHVLREKYYTYFFKDQYDDWKSRGSKKLEQLQAASSMLICAEDLGMVPDFVEGVLHEKEMLGLQVQRMPKKMGMLFSSPSDAPYLSVVTPSTHDMSPLRSWWEEDLNLTNKFYHEIMHGSGDAPESCSEEAVQWIIREHLQSPAMWSLFLIQDILSICETSWNPDLSSDRINNPANPFHYWNYRMHINIESLLENQDLIKTLRRMIAESGRMG